MTRTDARNRRRSPARGAGRRNVQAEAVATSLQSTCEGWVVIWSAWRQAFTAFCAIVPEALIIDDPSVSGLLQRMGEVELAASVPGLPVDRVLGEGKVHRAAGIMRDRIVRGDWPSGRKILSDDEPAAILRVDPDTARLALSHLERIGYLKTVPGRGVYVRPRTDWPEAVR